jgi:HK97 gp10 family phage protein
MAVKVTLDYDRTDNIANAIERDVDDAITDGTAEMVGTAQAIVPVDTGRLRASISMRRAGPLSWIFFSDTEYDVFVEYGTRNMAAQPYMRPAYERHRPGIIAACEMAIARHAAGR